jgi:hypothetical protein
LDIFLSPVLQSGDTVAGIGAAEKPLDDGRERGQHQNDAIGRRRGRRLVHDPEKAETGFPKRSCATKMLAHQPFQSEANAL